MTSDPKHVVATVHQICLVWVSYHQGGMVKKAIGSTMGCSVCSEQQGA